MRLVWVQTRDALQICDSREVCICRFVDVEGKMLAN